MEADCRELVAPGSLGQSPRQPLSSTVMSQNMESSQIYEKMFIEASEAWENHDYKKAFELFLESAKGGESSSQLNIGYFYDEGICVPKNMKKAIYWYKKASMQNNGGATTNIAIHYRTIKEYRKALWWFHKAVKQLDHDAYFDIGCLYENGLGVKKNIKKALHYYKEAVNAEHITEDTVIKAKERIKKLRT